MKKCEICGYISNDTAVYCTNCGNLFQQSDQIVSDNMKVCSACGMPMDNSVTHCTNCGYVFKNVQAQSHQQSSHSSTSRTGTYGDVPPTSFDTGSISAPHHSDTTSGSKKESHTVFWIILIVLIVAIIALSAILVYNLALSNKGNETSSSGTEEIPTPGNTTYSHTAPKKPVVEPQTKKISEYDVYISDSTWEQANSAAKQNGGELVCVESQEEFEKICNLAEKHNIYVFWLGMKRTSDDWYQCNWNDGSDFEYHPWKNNEPSYYENGNPEYYLMAFKVNGTWYFNDAVNDVSKHYSGKMGYIVETVTEVEIEE